MTRQVANRQPAEYRHAAEYRQRARELVDQAWGVPGEGDRKHFLELAAIYERTADKAWRQSRLQLPPRLFRN